MEGRTVIPWDKDDHRRSRLLQDGRPRRWACSRPSARRSFDPPDRTRARVLATLHGPACGSFIDARGPCAPRGLALRPAPRSIPSLAQIPPEDPATYDAICRADTVGVFQIESRAQMAMLPRLQAQQVLRSGDRGRDRPTWAHPGRHGPPVPAPPDGAGAGRYRRTRCLEPHPGAHARRAALPGAGHADRDGRRRLHRRARPTSCAATWRRGRSTGRLEGHRGRLTRRASPSRDLGEDFGDELYQQIQGFGEYGFPESHAASFALLVYASCVAQAATTRRRSRCALLNAQPMGLHGSPSTLVQGRAAPRRGGAAGVRGA